MAAKGLTTVPTDDRTVAQRLTIRRGDPPGRPYRRRLFALMKRKSCYKKTPPAGGVFFGNHTGHTHNLEMRDASGIEPYPPTLRESALRPLSYTSHDSVLVRLLLLPPSLLFRQRLFLFLVQDLLARSGRPGCSCRGGAIFDQRECPEKRPGGANVPYRLKTTAPSPMQAAR